MKGQALRPNFFNSLPTFVKDKEAEKKGASEEERLLYSLSQTAGWRFLKEYIDNLLDDLDNANNVAISQGLSFEEIGKNTIVISQTKGILKKIIDKIEDAKEVCEKPDGTAR